MSRSRTPMATIPGPPAEPSAGYLFPLPEYEQAFLDIFGRSIDELVDEKAPVLAQMPLQEAEHVRTTHVTLPTGEVITRQPYRTELSYTVDIRDVVAFDVGAFAAQCDAAAEQTASIVIENLIQYSDQITEGFGHVSSADGEPFGWPMILKGLGMIEVDFDKAGAPILPLLVHSRDPRRPVSYPQPNDEEKAAFESLIARKREEFHARQRAGSIS